MITGINGSGKSTYLKQIAIIAILAHCGSYIPAEHAVIPIRDRICTRIGNADDQEHNISTFLLEMKETAFICNAATEKSLILLDELGRATSNEDGVAIAWAVSEYLLKKRAMTFFVTHYSQLTRLAEIYPSVQNYHLEATIGQGARGSISYTHKVRAGACTVATDYGVEMAAACGWPIEIVDQAKAVEANVQAHLPGDNLCQARTQQQQNIIDSRTQAFKNIRTIVSNLRYVGSDSRFDSPTACRSFLHAMQQSLLNNTDNETLERMKVFLFRDADQLLDEKRQGSLPDEAFDSIPQDHSILPTSDTCARGDDGNDHPENGQAAVKPAQLDSFSSESNISSSDDESSDDDCSSSSCSSSCSSTSSLSQPSIDASRRST